MSKPIKKVLIVDDDSDIRQSVRLALEEQDFMRFEITECADAASGLDQLIKLKPEIVILDLHMPGKSGFDFMDVMRKDKSLSNIKVIMLSADDTIPNIFEAEDRGIEAFHFLGKPFNISDLQALVLSLSLLT